MSPQPSNYEDNVFINCPFDEEYRPMFRAMVFVIHDAGFIARCALEAENSAQARLDKILNIIDECKYGIHDLSRTELSHNSGLPRFNTPFELGLYLGCRKFGEKRHRSKHCLILDSEPYRYQRFISDIAGQDIQAHNDEISKAIVCIRNWLRANAGRSNIPGGEYISERYQLFEQDLPTICQKLHVSTIVETLPFVDFSHIVSEWLADHPLSE